MSKTAPISYTSFEYDKQPDSVIQYRILPMPFNEDQIKNNLLSNFEQENGNSETQRKNYYKKKVVLC